MVCTKSKIETNTLRMKVAKNTNRSRNCNNSKQMNYELGKEGILI